MNKNQKLVQERFLDNEDKVINALQDTYEQAYKDITDKIKDLDSSIEKLQKAYDSIEGDEIGELAQALLSKNRKYTPEEAKETLQSMLQSKVYQRDYQKALGKQVDDILGKMAEKQFKTVSDYLNTCYEDGFIGTMFDLQGQGIPLCFPLDQESMVRAVQLDSPISSGLYNHLGENVNELKKRITAEVSRGISTGMSFERIAKQISLNMKGTYENPGGSYAYALRVARTEGHRIQCQASMDACYKAREKGADVVKQWDATLDGKTRESHQKVDGEIREIDEKFSNGLMFPGDPSGGVAEVVNCRCSLLERARWALDEAELEHLKERAEYFGLDKAEQFEDFKKKYLTASKTADMQQYFPDARPPRDYDGIFDDFAELNLSKEENDALSNLWHETQNSGFEYGAIIENGSISKTVTNNMTDAVKVPLDDYGKNLTVLHSHTNSTPFSATDFQRLLDERIDKIGVIGYNADVYIAYIGNGEIPLIEDFVKTATDISREADIAIMEHPNFFDWEIEERNYMAIREQAYRISQYYGWTLEGGRIDVK